MTLKRIGIVVLVATVLVGQSARAGAQEREAPARPSTPTPSGSPQPAMMMTVGGTLADLFTTLSVLNNGGREVNPVLGQSPARIIATKSLLLVPQLLAERHLAKHGHPRAAMWLGIALGGLGTAMAVHNMNVGH